MATDPKKDRKKLDEELNEEQTEEVAGGLSKEATYQQQDAGLLSHEQLQKGRRRRPETHGGDPPAAGCRPAELRATAKSGRVPQGHDVADRRAADASGRGP